VVQVALDNPSTGAGITMGSPYYSYRKALPDERKWQIGDTATWQHKNHSVKFGIDMVHNYDLINNTYESNGVYTYAYLGNYFADLLNETGTYSATGVCNSTTSVSNPATTTATNFTGTAPCGTFVQGFGPPAFDIATMDYGYFVEDHYKMSPRLTFDVGLRYDYEQFPQPYAALTQPSGGFTPYLASTNGLCNGYAGPGTCPTLASQANITNRPSEKTEFGPRIGVAYDLSGDGKTTLRFGYGLYFGRTNNGDILNTNLNTGSPLGQYTSSSYTPATAGAPKFPNIIGAGAFGAGPTSYFFSPNFKNPSVHQFDLSIQRQVTRGMVVQLSYLGALSRDLPNALNINLNPNANTVATAASAPNGVVQTVIMVSDSTGQGPLPNGKTFTVPTYTGTGTTNKIDPIFGAINEAFSNITANYHAFVAEVKNNSSKLVQYDVNYTWSHALDYNQNATTNQLSSGWLDPYNISGYGPQVNYGNSIYNTPNRLVAYALINEPMVVKSGWAKWFADDWSLNPLYQMQSGLAYSAAFASSSGSSSYLAAGSGFTGGGVNGFIPGIGRNTYKYPRSMILDMRLQKEFPITVRDRAYHLQAMAEAFNLANHQNVTGVQTGAYSFTPNGNGTTPCNVPGSTTATFGAVAGQAQDECAVMTYQPHGGTGTSQTGFGAVTSSNNTYLFTPREIEVTLRLQF
jgi:hypothetical protein